MRTHAAGIDIGAKNIFVAIEGKKVRSFETFTESFQQATSYLLENRIETVAMEATGVYWIILYEMLEAAGGCMVDRWQTNQTGARSKN